MESSCKCLITFDSPVNTALIAWAATQFSERPSGLVQKTMETNNDTKETMDHDVKRNKEKVTAYEPEGPSGRRLSPVSVA